MRAIAALAALVALAGVVPAQVSKTFFGPSLRDFEVVRRRPQPYPSLLALRGGLSGGLAQDADPDVGREDGFAADGFVLFRSDRLADGAAALDAYAGRDGAYVSLRNDKLTDSGGGRIELSGRYFPFYREGFYGGDEWVPTGRYQGTDYGIYAGLSTELGEGAMMEAGPFYRWNRFERNDSTSPGYTLPGDYQTYGIRSYFEQGTLQLDRDTGLPNNGFLATIRVDYELNSADQLFGTDLWASKLPDSFWRGTLHLEWYFPTDGSDVWVLQLDGAMADDKDRIHMFDAQKPIGTWWGDGTLGYRLHLARSFHITPFGHLQYTRTLDERGENTSDDFWYGGGLRLRFDFGDAISVLGDYSYLSNANRPSISWQEDIYGEHQFFAGLEVRFGASKF